MRDRGIERCIFSHPVSDKEFLLSKITEKMSSMHLTVWTLVFLILCTSVGIYMAGAESFMKDFRLMNNMLIRDWLFSDKAGSGFLKTWFVTLCAAMTVLGINLIFCSWSKIFRVMRAKFSGNQLFMLIVHALFGFAALGHFGGLILGFEYNNIRLGEGDKYSIKEGYEVEVTNVHFVGDIKALKKSRRDITRDELNHKESYADVTLRRGGELLKSQKVYLLKPMNYKDVHVTLRRFVSPDKIKGEVAPETTAWVMVTLSRNPALKMFLAIYPVMIAGIFIYLIITWRKSRFNNNNIPE